MEIRIMKKITITSILVILVLSTMLSACTASKKADCTTPIGLVDGLDRSVCLAAPAQRIVSMSPSATEILYAIGAGSQVVGRDSFSDYPEEAKAVTDIGGSMGNYSYEAIAALKPDLVIATEINTAEQVKSLEDLGLTVYYISNPTDFDGLYQIIKNVGVLTGHDSDAASLVEALDIRVQAVITLIKKTTSRPVVFYELDGSDPAKPYTSGPGTFIDMLIKTAGGKNVGSSLKSSWAQISVEELVVQDPDIILLGDSAYGTTSAQVAARTGWANIKAVKNSQIYPVNDDMFSLAGPRLVDGLEVLAKLIHPELYRSTAN
jgi:iron complex transport system substrate-binding protein